MDPLSQILLARASQPPVQPEPQVPPAQAPPPDPQAQTPAPAVPPNVHPKVPQAAKRFSNAQAIMDAYRQDWTPNPIILQATLGNK